MRRNHSWSLNAAPRDVLICSVFRNEAGVLDEFVAFHWLQGVGRFVLFDDKSVDRPLEVLQKYIDLGIVVYRNISQGEPSRMMAAMMTMTV
jgi:hypothetical protein